MAFLIPVIYQTAPGTNKSTNINVVVLTKSWPHNIKFETETPIRQSSISKEWKTEYSSQSKMQILHRKSDAEPIGFLRIQKHLPLWSYHIFHANFLLLEIMFYHFAKILEPSPFLPTTVIQLLPISSRYRIMHNKQPKTLHVKHSHCLANPVALLHQKHNTAGEITSFLKDAKIQKAQQTNTSA